MVFNEFWFDIKYYNIALDVYCQYHSYEFYSVLLQLRPRNGDRYVLV